MNEIVYSIDSQSTLEQGCLVLDLLELKKEELLLSSRSENRLVFQWRALAIQPADKEIFAFLLKEELAFQQRLLGKAPYLESLSLKQMRVSPAQVFEVFKLFSKTPKLYYQGKQLVIDLFGQADFYYEVIPLETNKWDIKGRLHWRQTDIPLTDCEALGPGKSHWFVRGLTLRTIKTSINWKKLQVLKQDSLILEGGAKQAFLEEIDPEDLETPQLVFKEGFIQEASQHITPYPFLMLKDRWGACADLWMDYGHGHRIAFHDPSPFVKDMHGKNLFKRLKDLEINWEKDLLETDFIKKTVGSTHYYCPLDCVAKSLTFLLEIGWNIQDFQNRKVIKQTGQALQLEDQTQAIMIKGHLNYENYQADVKSVLGTFNRRETFIQLSSDTVGLLPIDATYQAWKDLAEESESIGQGIQLKKSRFSILEPLWNDITGVDSLMFLKDKWQNFSGIQETPPSLAFQGQLRPYQQQGLNWLSFLHDYGFHGILADEMGLGKTVQILAFLSLLPTDHPHLIVLPTSLLFNWRYEICKFLPSWTYIVHQGAKRATQISELQKFNIILTSYTTLRLDLPLLQTLSYHCVILDEAQIIKNAHTQTAQAACQLKAKLKLCLTGTPIENHLQELWSHFHFLMPDLFGSLESFEADIQAAQADRRYLERIKRKINPFLLRRRKQDVAPDLPPRIDQVVWIEMQEEQRALYDQILRGFKQGLLKKVEMEGMQKHRLEILEALLRLRQVCCHPLLISSLSERTPPPSAKFDALLQDLETIREEGHKVLIYSQFSSMLKLMAKTAKERDWSYAYLDGSTINREEVVEQFQKSPAQHLFFISLKAGGVGLNLTAADYVYLYDPWWNEAVEEQAINRAHRIGRQDPVFAKRLVMTESIEEKMMKLKAAKRSLVEDLFDASNIAQPLTLEDLQFLFT